MILYAATVPYILYLAIDLEDQGITAIAVAADQDSITLLGLLQGRHQQHQRHRCAGKARGHEHGVLNLSGIELQYSRRCVHMPGVVGETSEPCNVLRLEVIFIHSSRNPLGDYAGIPFFTYESLFVGANKGIPVRPPHIHEVLGYCMAPHKVSSHRVIADENSPCPVAEEHLVHPVGAR